jgi:hypothetical protein
MNWHAGLAERAMMVKSQRLMALTADTAGWLKRHRLE